MFVEREIVIILSFVSSVTVRFIEDVVAFQNIRFPRDVWGSPDGSVLLRKIVMEYNHYNAMLEVCPRGQAWSRQRGLG